MHDLIAIARALGVPVRSVGPDYGSPDHERAYARVVDRLDPWEAKARAMVESLFRDQTESVLERLTGQRSAATAAADPFDLETWRRLFTAEMTDFLRDLFDDLGQGALDQLDISISFDLFDPRVLEALESQASRFGDSVNQTTFDALKKALGQGLEAGESIPDLAKRVRQVMGVRVDQATAIARTETTAASTKADVEAWRQSGVVTQKQWLASLDSRVRPSHRAAHGQRVDLDGEFTVGGATGPSPGNMSTGAESINCRCSMLAVLKGDEE